MLSATMRRILVVAAALAALAPIGLAIAKPVHRRRPAPANPTPPATPPSVSSPPALSNEPEPTPVPAAPAANPSGPPPAAPEPPPPPKKSAVELDGLVAEYTAIRDELFRSRAKGAVLGEALLKTHLVVMFRYEAGRAWPLKKINLKLDERPVYSGESINGADYSKIFETVAAPGRHVLSVRVEASGTGEDRITYAAEGTFGFELADDKLTRVELTADESGSGPSAIAKRKEGSFDLRVKANIKALDVEKK